MFFFHFSCKEIISAFSTLEDKKDYYILKNTGGNLKLKILSFNILASVDLKALDDGYQVWSERDEKVISFIKSSQADFIAIQECMPGQLDYIDKKLSAKYYVIENKSYTPDSILLVKRSDFDLIETGHWILLEDALEFGIRRIAIWAKVRHLASKRELLMVSTHVDAKSIKKEQIERLFSKLTKHQDSKAPLFVAGDFNTAPDDDDYKIIMDFGWQDSFLSGTSKVEATYPAKNPRHRIDHIFYYPENSLEVVSWSVDTQVLSDHLPVTSSFNIPGN